MTRKRAAFSGWAAEGFVGELGRVRLSVARIRESWAWQVSGLSGGEYASGRCRTESAAKVAALKAAHAVRP